MNRALLLRDSVVSLAFFFALFTAGCTSTSPNDTIGEDESRALEIPQVGFQADIPDGWELEESSAGYRIIPEGSQDQAWVEVTLTRADSLPPLQQLMVQKDAELAATCECDSTTSISTDIITLNCGEDAGEIRYLRHIGARTYRSKVLFIVHDGFLISATFSANEIWYATYMLEAEGIFRSVEFY